MSDIGLRDYLAKLDALFDSGDANQVIHHCRQILQYYPKNVEAYRILGRALLETQSFAEAGEVFRRVLSVFPDDLTAHIGLSEVALQDKRPDDAIWHMERAYEQDPNSPDIIEQLRELYRRYRRIELSRLQLTTGTVVRQYLRNGLYEQAIDTVQQSLERSPERIDLQVLLAQIYWEGGHKIEAGETAMEIVRQMPDCLEANRILTLLWLSENRPTDAQRYINRIQSVDPYLALELAQGEAVPSDAFRLEELDYRRAAEKVVTQTPDWLRNMEAPAEGGLAQHDDDWMRATGTLPAVKLEQAPDEHLPDDWFSDQPTTHENVPPKRRTGLTGLLASLDLPEEPDADEPVAADADSALPAMDLFGDLTFAETEQPDEPSMPSVADMSADDLFGDLDDEPAAVTGTGPETDNDPLAWLRDSGITVDESANRAQAGFVDDDEELKVTDTQNPLAWMQGFDANLVAGESSPMLEDDLPPADGDEDDADDPLSWLKDSAPATTSFSSSRTTVQATTPDWTADESLLDEALNLEALLEDTPADSAPMISTDQGAATAQTPDGQDAMSNDVFDWLNQPDSQPESEKPDSKWMAGESKSEPEAEDEFPGAILLGGDSDSDVESEQPDDAGFQWLDTEAPASAVPPTAETEFDDLPTPDWLAAAAPVAEDEAVEDETPDWLKASAPVVAEEEASAPADGGFQWLDTSTSSVADEEEAVEDETPDWLKASAPVAEEETTADETPDWLTGGAVSASAPTDDGFQWLDTSTSSVADEEEAAEDETPDWLKASAPVAEEEAAADEPDWLTGGAVSASAPTDDGFQWMDTAVQADSLDLSTDEEEAVEDETPDWLKASAPVIDMSEDSPVQATGLNWLNAEDESSVEDQVDQGVPSSAGDWMQSASVSDAFDSTWGDGDAEVEASADETPDWLNAAEAESGESDVQQPAAEEPEWLSAVKKSAVSADASEFQWDEPVASAEAVPEWLSTLESQPQENIPPQEVAADQDWLSDAKPGPTASDLSEWMHRVTPDSAEPAASADVSALQWMDDTPAHDEIPDWLAASEPDAPAETGELTAETANHDDWLGNIRSEKSVMQEEAPPEPDASSTFSWLNDVSPSATVVPAGEPKLVPVEEMENDFGEVSTSLDDLAMVDESGIVVSPNVANNAPDWLNAMVPGLDVDFEAPEDEQIESEFLPSSEKRAASEGPESVGLREQRDFAWLEAIVEEESQQVSTIDMDALQEKRSKRFSFSRLPPWLRQPLEKKPKATPPAAPPADDIDLPPWLQ